jgi:hypothetical protein
MEPGSKDGTWVSPRHGDGPGTANRGPPPGRVVLTDGTGSLCIAGTGTGGRGAAQAVVAAKTGTVAARVANVKAKSAANHAGNPRCLVGSAPELLRRLEETAPDRPMLCDMPASPSRRYMDWPAPAISRVHSGRVMAEM